LLRLNPQLLLDLSKQKLLLLSLMAVETRLSMPRSGRR
jgi:hypothetical protein